MERRDSGGLFEERVKKFLELFFSNLLLGANYELKNRHMHVDYVEVGQSANVETSKCKNCTLECTLEELALLRLMTKNPSITQKELAERLGKSERTVKTKVLELQQKNYIRRVNGKRYGTWEVLMELSEE